MRLATMVQVFFVIYCFEAGFVLLIAPWSPPWDRTVMQISIASLQSFLLNPLLRGGVSGFGLIHLVWGTHDLTVLLTRRSRPDAGTGL